MPTALQHIFGNTYGFGFVEDETCKVYDHRKYCQQVQQDDRASFQFIAALCGDDVVQCGNFNSFACTSANWTFSNWSWNGSMVHTVGSGDPLTQSAILQNGKVYKITITVSRVANPFLEINGSITVGGKTITKAGTYIIYWQAVGTDLVITPTTTFDGAVDDISAYLVGTEYKVFLKNCDTGEVMSDALDVKPVPDLINNVWDGNFISAFDKLFSDFNADPGCYCMCIASGCDNNFAELVEDGGFDDDDPKWTFGTGWTQGSSKACSDGSAGTLSQVLATLAGKKYNITLTVSGRTAGSINVSLGGVLAGNIATNGTFTFEAVLSVGNAETLSITSLSAFDGCVDSVSVTLSVESYTADSCSQCLDLRTTHACTRKISWTNDDNAFGFIYSSNYNYTFTQAIRVEAAFWPIGKYKEDQTQFMNSAGTKEITYFEGDKKKRFETEPLPEYIHDALSIGKGHDHFYIDGTEYVCDEGFEPADDSEYMLLLVPVELMVRKKTILEQNKKY